jgi:hypothetical protein
MSLSKRGSAFCSKRGPMAHTVERGERTGCRILQRGYHRHVVQCRVAESEASVLVFHRALDQRIENGGTTMRRIFFIGLFALLSPGVLPAQAQPYRVVFDLTSRDSLEQKAVLRWLREVGTSSPNAQMEVVMYGKGFELVMPERSSYLAEVKEAIKNPNV